LVSWLQLQYFCIIAPTTGTGLLLLGKLLPRMSLLISATSFLVVKEPFFKSPQDNLKEYNTLAFIENFVKSKATPP